MQWPWPKFEAIYAAMLKRHAVESIEAQKHQMIAALYSNSAYNEDAKGPEIRQNAIRELEEHFNKAVELVYHPELHKEEEIDWSNPFWAAAKRGYDKKMQKLRGENFDPDATVGSVVQMDQDQLNARRESRAQLMRENT